MSTHTPTTKFLLLLGSFRLLWAAPALPERFYESIRNDDTVVVHKLIESAATDSGLNNVKDKYGATPLMYSAAVGSLASMKLLVDAGADVNAKNAFDVTALLLCAADEPKVHFLLSRGANANARSKQGRTALLIAAGTEGSSSIVKQLLKAGADLKAADANPVTTPLTAAADANDMSVFHLLLDHGAKLNGPAGEVALTSAAAHGNLEMMRLLLSGGVPADKPTPPSIEGPVKNGDIALGLLTPLHFAAPTGGPEAVKLLLESGANPNNRDVRGMTPLMLAIGTDHPDVRVVHLLLGHGADPTIKSKAGETAFDWARKFNRPEILSELHLSAAENKVVFNAKPLPVSEGVRKSADLLQRTSASFFVAGGCASCHSHNLTSIALEKAKAAGAWVPSEPASSARAKQTQAFWSSQQQMLFLRMDPPGGPNRTAFGVLEMAATRVKADATTDAMVHNLAATQKLDGNWHDDGIVRPPMGEGDITDTALAIRSLSVYGPEARKAEFSSRIARAVVWLREASPLTSEDTNMQLLGVVWGGADRATLDRFCRKIMSQQRPDGGWSQSPYLSSDAYATGQTLAALEEAGVRGDATAYRKGVDFLLRTQCADGSWHVASRAPKFQPYFQSGFPHDHDQWISMAATAWATMGLAHAL